MTRPPDHRVIVDGYARARETFGRLIGEATPEDLRRRSDGTRWTNRQLLFHMLFGYLIVRQLLWLVKLGGRLPMAATRPFATLLNWFTGPFNTMNYLGSVIGGRLFTPERMITTMDRVTSRLEDRLARESDSSLARGMHFPTKWDPFFKDHMSLQEVYHYPTQHFEFHSRQLSLKDHRTSGNETR